MHAVNGFAARSRIQWHVRRGLLVTHAEADDKQVQARRRTPEQIPYPCLQKPATCFFIAAEHGTKNKFAAMRLSCSSVLGDHMCQDTVPCLNPKYSDTPYHRCSAALEAGPERWLDFQSPPGSLQASPSGTPQSAAEKPQSVLLF